MKLDRFDFRIWDNSNMLYLENPAIALFKKQSANGDDRFNNALESFERETKQ